MSLTVILFGLTIFLLLLPLIEKKLMDGKREMIRELTESSWSILAAHAQEESDGLLTREKAQTSAIENLRRLRYGPELKDYFWINDMHPRIIMHPYRPDLEGKDISDFTDPNGKRLFVEFVKVVKANSAGYVDYEWQWKDDPGRIVPKISYVNGFEPWGWIVGTGIYLEDVRAEIAAIIRELQSLIIDALSRHKSGVLGLEAFRSHIGRSQPVKIGRVKQSPNSSGESPSIVFAGPELPSIKQATDLLIREALQRANGNQSIYKRGIRCICAKMRWALILT